jgi:hypothetical protein
MNLRNVAGDFLKAVKKAPFVKYLTPEQAHLEAVPSDPLEQNLRYFLFELQNEGVTWKRADGPKIEDCEWTEIGYNYRQVPESQRGRLCSKLKAYENAARTIQPRLPEKGLPSTTVSFLKEMRKTVNKFGVISLSLIRVILLNEPDDSEYLKVCPQWSEPVLLRGGTPIDVSKAVATAVLKREFKFK